MSRYLTDNEVAFVMESRAMGIGHKYIARELGKDPTRMKSSMESAQRNGMADKTDAEFQRLIGLPGLVGQRPRFTERGRNERSSTPDS